MHNINKENYGYKYILKGFVKEDEMQELKDSAEKQMLIQIGSFSAFFDITELGPLPSASREIFKNLIKLLLDKKLKRSFIVGSNATSLIQFKDIFSEAGSKQLSRFVNSERNPNYQEMGEKWLLMEIEPNIEE